MHYFGWQRGGELDLLTLILRNRTALKKNTSHSNCFNGTLISAVFSEKIRAYNGHVQHCIKK